MKRLLFRDVLFEHHQAVVEQLDQLEVCLPYSRLQAGIPILAVFQGAIRTKHLYLYKPIKFMYLCFVNLFLFL